MEKQTVIIAIRRVFDEEAESADFFVEVYDEELNLLHKKQKSNLEEAKELAEFGYLEEYEVLDIRFLFEEETIHDEKPKMISTEPQYYHYIFDIIEFEKDIKNWLKYEKGWIFPFSFSYEGPDDYGSLGSLYMTVDHESLDQDTLEEISDWYCIRDLDYVLEPILEEMFNARGTYYDFNMGSEQIYIFVPIRKPKILTKE